MIATALFGAVRPGPAMAAKNPPDMRTAAAGIAMRAVQPQKPSRPVASARIRLTRLRMTRTPAWACPAREKDFWKSVSGTLPAAILSRKAPPNSMVTMVSRPIPAMMREASLRAKVDSNIGASNREWCWKPNVRAGLDSVKLVA
ncbi:hypothetical protein [Glycomyces sp. NPDC021274]|uniref:hypothetical protein n=1 Tax=Glycomyces sp. NPDC021274 TaxID=3155120 RepID=UPI00340B8307